MNPIRTIKRFGKRCSSAVRRSLIVWPLRLQYPGRIKTKKVQFGRGTSFDIRAANFQMTIGDAKFSDYCFVRIRQDGELAIDSGVFFNAFCSVNCLGSIQIGRNTIFGEAVRIYDHNHKFRDVEAISKIGYGKQGYSIGNVKIGSGCWIGSNVVILKNVVVGDHVVIGAGCTLSNIEIPAHSIVRQANNLDIKKMDVAGHR